MPDCPYPPSDPFCQHMNDPLPVTTTIPHVIVDNQPSSDISTTDVLVRDSVDAVNRSVGHMEATLAFGFIAVCVCIVVFGALIAKALITLNEKRPNA